MGSIREHNLENYIRNHRLEVYVETGTGEGECLAYAIRFPFQKYYTVDIDQELLKQVYDKFKDSGREIAFYAGLSTQALKHILPRIPQETPTLFFLDAHFPGADFHKCSYEDSLRVFRKDAFPLEAEVNTILEMRDVSKDVFIIDDLMLYEEGDYESIRVGVVWKHAKLQEELNLQTSSAFLYEKLNKTHDFKKDLKSQGYLIFTPKVKNEL